jgi:hypothetical protein
MSEHRSEDDQRCDKLPLRLLKSPPQRRPKREHDDQKPIGKRQMGPNPSREAMPRLNGWQRVGVVLSVVWAIGASAYEFVHIGDREQEKINFFLKVFYDQCREAQDLATQAGRPFERDCVGEQYNKHLPSLNKEFYYSESRWGVATMAFVPIAITWLLAWWVISIVRWIKSGFA